MRNLKQTMYQMRVKDGDGIVAHVVNLCSTRAELQWMGSKLSDEEFNNILASSLPATWDTIMMSYLENGMPSQQFVTIVCNEYYKSKAASQQV